MSDGQSNLTDRDKAIVAEILAAALDREDRPTQAKHPLRRAFEYGSKHIAAVIAVFAVMISLVGYFAYDLSLLEQLAKMSREQEQYRRQVAEFDERARMSNIHVGLGNAFLDSLHYAAALEEFQKAREINELNTEAQKGVLKASVLLDTSDPEITAEINATRIEHVIDEYGQDKHTQVALAEQYRRLGERDKAIHLLLQAIDLDQNLSSAYYVMGMLFGTDETPDAARAIGYLEQAVRLSPWNEKYLSNLTYFYSRDPEYEDEVLELYRKVVRIEPRFLLGYYGIAHTCLRRNNLACARQASYQLVAGLQNEDYRSYTANRSAWLTIVDGQRLFLRGYENKLAYSESFLLLCTYLLEGNEKALLIKKASSKQVEPRSEEVIRLVLRSEIKQLHSSQPDLQEKLSQFENLYLTSRTAEAELQQP